MVVAQCVIALALFLVMPCGLPADSPEPARVSEYIQDVAMIMIFGDDNFTAENGVSSGNGTYDNPYVIENKEMNISSGLHGIYILYTTAYFVVRNMNIHSGLIIESMNAASASFRGGAGISLQNVANGRIENCTLVGDLTGIDIMWSTGNILIEHNTIKQNLIGIQADSSSYVTIRDNDISDSLGENVELTWVSHFNLLDNSVTSPGEWGFTNVDLYDSDDCTIQRNYIANGDSLGINIGFCSRCDVTNNTIEKHRVGIEVYGSEEVTYEPNVFVGNNQDIESDVPNRLSDSVVVIATMAVTAVVTAIVVVLLMRKGRTSPPAFPEQPGTRPEK